jgi:rhodanese-related sulfurtransferase
MQTQEPPDLSVQPVAFNALMGHAGSPLVLDVRREAKFVESGRLVVGAVRCAPEDVGAFAAARAAANAVVYCVYGHNVSEDATNALRAAGWAARRIAGGIEGGQPGTDTEPDRTQWAASPVLTFAKRPDWGVARLTALPARG